MVHIPVLLHEVLRELDPKPGGNFIDCTAGEGGHTIALARLVGPLGNVLAIERDPDIFTLLSKNIAEQNLEESITAVQGNYSNIERITEQVRFPEAHGILFDVGFSSWHIETSKRGFSFQEEEPLDMRYDPADTTLPTAADIVNGSTRDELVYILREFGEERRADKIAKAIFDTRKRSAITTTKDLVDIITSVVPRYGRLHPATKTFQALRIAVNRELEAIGEGLEGAYKVAAPEGRIAFISFHSLEDRIAKNIFREWDRQKLGSRVNKKVIRPSREETKNNPRARSAKLRIFQKAISH